MNADRAWRRSPLVLSGVGALLFATAIAHHAREILVLNGFVGPVLALLLDGVPALGLVYAGYRLSRSDFSPRERWTVVVWSLSGIVLLVSVMTATFLVRAFEGRQVIEPAFPLLVAAEAGGIAGFVAGYYNARARTDARRSRAVSNALGFINDLIRHDLRNDLNVIQGHAELLAAADDDTDAGIGTPDAIAGKTDEALSRIETSRVIADTLVGNPDFEPVDLVAVIREIATRVDDTFEATVETDLPDTAVVTANDGIRSVVDNLLENAVEHNNADDPWVAVGVTVAADTVQLTVTDNGPGIPEDVQESLFEADEAGSGGGLSLIYTLVTGYGGDVRIEDADSGGARVVVILPRDDA